MLDLPDHPREDPYLAGRLLFGDADPPAGCRRASRRPRTRLRPTPRLRAFAKVSLRPGRTRHAVLTLDPRSFSGWDTAAGHWATAPGRYTGYAGDSSRDLPLHRTLTVRR